MTTQNEADVDNKAIVRNLTWALKQGNNKGTKQSNEETKARVGDILTCKSIVCKE